jgi:hypothetical protein
MLLGKRTRRTLESPDCGSHAWPKFGRSFFLGLRRAALQTPQSRRVRYCLKGQMNLLVFAQNVLAEVKLREVTQARNTIAQRAILRCISNVIYVSAPLSAINAVDGSCGAFAEVRRCFVMKNMTACRRLVWLWLSEPTYPTSRLAGLRSVERARNYGPGK